MGSRVTTDQHHTDHGPSLSFSFLSNQLDSNSTSEMVVLALHGLHRTKGWVQDSRNAKEQYREPQNKIWATAGPWRIGALSS